MNKLCNYFRKYTYLLPNLMNGCTCNDSLVGTGEIDVARSKIPKTQRWFGSVHAQIATYVIQGWYTDWEIKVCVGRKPKEV